MTSRIIRTDEQFDALVRFLLDRPKPFTVTIAKGANRSLPQNATIHKWFSQIAEETGESTAEIKALCKFRFGLPIISENAAWVEKWEPMYSPLPYEMKLRLFEVIPVTSLFGVKQMTAFMDAVQREYRAQGIQLIDPEARRYEAMK